MRKFVVSILTTLVAIASASASDWPQFLGPTANGMSPETGINKDWAKRPPKLLWKVPMHDQGFACPSVANGKVYILDHQGENDVLRAIDLGTGKDVWTFDYPVPGTNVYGFSRATPVVEDGRIYILSRDGLLQCLEENGGKKIWGRNVLDDFKGRKPRWNMGTSPIIDGEKLVVCPYGPDAVVVALNKKTGETLWQGGGTDPAGYSTPVIATINGVKQYVIFTGGNVIGVAAKDGKRLWEFPWKTERPVHCANAVVHDNMVFITSNYGRGGAVIRIEKDGPKQLWDEKHIQSHFSTPVLHEGYLYSTSDPGRLVCLEMKTGKVAWETKGFQKGGLMAIDGVLIVVDGANGDVAMVEMTPKAYKELGRIKPLGGQSWTPPVVAQKKLIVRNKEAIACLDLE